MGLRFQREESIVAGKYGSVAADMAARLGC